MVDSRKLPIPVERGEGKKESNIFQKEGGVQTMRPARPHRKQPLPRARVLRARLLGRVGPSVGPAARGGGARTVRGQSYRGRNAHGVFGEQGVDPVGWCRKFTGRSQGDESGEVGASGAGSCVNARLQCLNSIQQAVGSPGRFSSREVACGHFHLGSRLDWEHF